MPFENYNVDDDLLNTSTSHYWATEHVLKSLDLAFRNQLTRDSPKAVQPECIRMPLRDHQKALIYEMQEREKACSTGITFSNTKTYVNYGVLGDEVGSGKSLVVLAYIGMMKQSGFSNSNRSILYPHSTDNFFTVYTKEYKNVNGPSLIIVPHNIYRQWQEYCKQYTTLNMFYAKSHKDIYEYEDSSGTKQSCIEKLLSSDAVLVSNTLYSTLANFAEDKNIKWKRVFLDEADTIHITSTSKKLDTPFTWFITATWPNLIMRGHCIRPLMMAHYNNHSNQYTPLLGDWLRSEIGAVSPTNMYSGRTTFLNIRSTRWLEQYTNQHVLRAIVLLTCSKEFLNESREMPPISYNTLLCEQPVSHRAILSVVNTNIQNMIHAGNIEGALQELGVSADTSMGLAEAVTREREKELDRLKKTLAFKQSIEYSTPHAKEVALAFLESKIKSVEKQIETIRERLTSTTVEECPICYDNPKENSATITPCCNRIFCGGCILQSLARGLSCPMCRAAIQANQLTQIVSEKKNAKKKKPETKLLSKPRQLLKFLKENKEARVLVFSRYENPFIQLERECEEEGITYNTLRGNKDVIASIVKSFEKGEKRVLFLPTESMGAGLNLVSASHIVLLHAMTPEEEKQAVGRAYRLGRTASLNVVRLLHEGETISEN